MNPQIGAVTQALPFFIGQYKIGWRRIFNFWIGLIGGLLLAGGISGWRKIIPIDVLSRHEIGVDKTSVNTGIKRQIRDQITLIYTHRNGKVIRVLANKDAYSEFVNQQVEYLENRTLDHQHKMKIMLEERLNLVFQELDNRVSNFSDWYFSYGTHYKILWEASIVFQIINF